MTTTLLASFPSPAQGVWHLGPVPIRAYALFIIIGIIAALVIGDRRWEARGGERGVIYDIALWAVPFGLIGGRLYHVLTDWPTYFGADGAGPMAALRIWDGGLGIWGAVALGGVGAWIGCRQRGIPLPAFADAIAPGIVLAQAIGRLGNYFNQELYGRETDVPWGMEIFYRRDPSGIIDVHSLNGVSTGDVYAVVHPTFLYELLWNLLVFAALLYIDRRFKIGHGRLFALYVAGYCVGRFVVELLRSDAATQIEGIRINSFTATFVFIGAVVYCMLAPKGRDDPETLRGNRADRDEVAGSEIGDTAQPAGDLAAVPATAGIVAAAIVAERVDEAREDEAPRPDTLDVAPDPAPDSETAAVLEVETAAEPEVELKPEVELEPEVEPEAELEVETDSEAETATEAEPDADGESSAPTDADDVEDAPEDEAIVEAELTAGSGLITEMVVEAENDQLIDEDHDPVDEEDLEGLQDDDIAVGIDGPTSEQQEELTDDAAAEAEAEAAVEEVPEPESAEPEPAEPEPAEPESAEPESAEADEAEAEAEVAADEAEGADVTAAETPDTDTESATAEAEAEADAEAEAEADAEAEAEEAEVEAEAEAEADAEAEAEADVETEAPANTDDTDEAAEEGVEDTAEDADTPTGESETEAVDEAVDERPAAESATPVLPPVVPQPAQTPPSGSRLGKLFRRRRS